VHQAMRPRLRQHAAPGLAGTRCQAADIGFVALGGTGLVLVRNGDLPQAIGGWLPDLGR